jgi:hypothetical protein
VSLGGAGQYGGCGDADSETRREKSVVIAIRTRRGVKRRASADGDRVIPSFYGGWG